MIDIEAYLAARERPPGRPVLYMNWRHLLFMHYSVDPEVVQATLPVGLTVDTFPDAKGIDRAWIGVVPFTMRDIRPLGLPALPWVSAFHETNVRTYVHRDGADPGVWFYSLDAARWLGCRIARATFGLPYHHAAMSLDSNGTEVHYASRRREGPRPAELRVRATLGDEMAADPGSFEFWLVERYLLHTVKACNLMTAAVHHQPYPLRHAQVEASEILWHSGSGGVPLDVCWEHVCYSPGVDVEVFRVH